MLRSSWRIKLKEQNNCLFGTATKKHCWITTTGVRACVFILIHKFMASSPRCRTYVYYSLRKVSGYKKCDALNLLCNFLTYSLVRDSETSVGL